MEYGLPECGYIPEADKYLKEFGIKYIITETHGILYANPTPIYGTFAPIVSPEGIIAFGRDIESSSKYGALLMVTLVTLIIENFTEILDMMFLMITLSHILLQMELEFILV